MKIGWIDTSELTSLNFDQFLTIREREEIAVAKDPQKRLRKQASRLLIKMLALVDSDSTLELQVSTLESFTTADFHQWEILGTRSTSKYLALYHAGVETEPFISISHGQGLSAACLSDGIGLGIDIERPALRRREFYEQNFTSYEREWVYENLNTEDDEDQLFTFLWTIKESLIKSGCTTRQSAWYIPEFSIQRLPRMEAFNDTNATQFLINDGLEHFRASTRYYSLGSQVLTTTFFGN